ncbi:hypothetical protein SAMN05216573_102176 [Bradyrhizobium sp. Rc3b]|uniref:hypothetical protein n=1 Tax=Bradyrhizobium sp. Rc3b TaxID=1855322 RepID=UPI0008EC6EB7|nr:hypothetical protein [Bradyrhizobium sp. Rc3b]SFM50698.1 hypothetical protein SAMN05216573_102176 [Bradyrhizobium sp. Rc3b]
MSLQLDIPEEYFDAKPYYRNRAAAEAVVREIKDHIKKTGEPHTWRHHTHSKPVTGSRIVYLGTYDLPPSHRAPDRHAPCPCCSPRAPKYSHNGKIAWFPDEHVIRMIGPDCFATLNPEGHWEAMEQFTREEAERRTIAYLLTNLHLNRPAREVITDALPALEAVDEVHTVLQHRLTEIIRIDLWRHVGRGSLDVTEMSRRMRRTRGGAEEVESFLDVRKLFDFPGYQMFSPKTSRLAGRIKGTAKRLSLLDLGDETQERVRAMTKEDQAKAARMLSQGITAAANIFADAEAIRSGFRPMSIANLRGWTKHKGCPVRLVIAGDERNFYIGPDEQHQLRVEIPPAFWRSFGELPKILTLTNWSED